MNNRINNRMSCRLGRRTLIVALTVCVIACCVTQITCSSGFKKLFEERPRQNICRVTYPNINQKSTNSTSTNSTTTTTTTTPPPELTYICPRPNEWEKKSYCCSNNKCCDKKEYEWEREQQARQQTREFFSKTDLGGVFKSILVAVLILVIVVLLLVCLCIKFICSKGKALSGMVLNRAAPSQQPMGVYPSQGDAQYQQVPGGYPPAPMGGYPQQAWPQQPPPPGPITSNAPVYPPYNSGPAYPMTAPPSGGFQQPPYNPNYG